MLSWVIINNEERGANYGVGTFIRNMVAGLLKFPDVRLTQIYIGGNRCGEFSVQETKNQLILKIPAKDNGNMFTDTVRNQEKYAARIADIISPYMQFRESIVIHINYLYQFFIAKEIKKRLHCRLIFTLHLAFNDDDSGKNKTKFALEKEAFILFDNIIAISKYEYDRLGKDKLINKDKLFLIENGIETEIFRPVLQKDTIRRKYGITDNERLIIFSGRLEEIKGLRYLIESFRIVSSKMPETRLIIAGDGEFRNYIDLCSGINTKVTFLGHLEYSSLLNLYGIADVGVIPSLEEPFGYVALEMMLSGLPVVASDTGGLKDIVSLSRHCCLIPMIRENETRYGCKPDTGFMAVAIIKLLNEKNTIFHDKSNICQRFSNSVMIKKYLSLITNQMNNHDR